VAGTSTSDLAERLTERIGADHVRAPTDAERRAAHMIVEPNSVEEICAIVRMCETDRITLAALGSARTLSQIRPSPVSVGISLKQMAQIVAHEPDDMTVVAEAGVTVGELNAATAPARQRLPVDPCDPGLTTLGSLIGASHAGPLRLSEGTSRDLLIGIRFVGHGGRQIHGGGRVVKNVAGYDLMKVMGGSFGTLGIITEATFKVRPLPARYGLAIIRYDHAADAFAAARTLNDALPLNHLEILSPALAVILSASAGFLLLAGFSGSSLEITYQAETVRKLTGPKGEILNDDDALGKYQLLRDIDFHSRPLSAQIAVAPARLAKTLDACGCEFRAHAGSGVAQLFLVDEGSAQSSLDAIARWRDAAHSARGNLLVIAASSEIREQLQFFDSPNDGALKLMRRLKTAFDPAGIFNPGCFVGGI
jgi:glycolate dehydrogenase FAD-binding subunit